MENRSHAIIAGLFTLFFLLAAAAGFWWLGGAHEQTNTYLLETQDSISGLNIETQVRYRGIRAGKVKDIRPDPADPTKLLVEIAVNKKYPLTSKTVAQLNQQGVTGLSYVMLDENVEDGVPGRPFPMDEGPPPRIRIQPGLLDELGDRAGDIASHLAELSLRLNRMLDDRNLRNLSRTLDNLATASDSLQELPRLMAALRGVLSARNIARLNSILEHLEQTAGAAAPLTVEARNLLASFNRLAHRFDGLADAALESGQHLNADTLPRVDALMRDAAAVTRRMERLLDKLDAAPQALLFGMPPPPPGPGEAGFVIPATKE